MISMNIGQLLADAWEHSIKTTPWDDGSDMLTDLLGGPRVSYRERLDRPRRNYRGEIIPQIDVVRHNLWKLKNGIK